MRYLLFLSLFLFASCAGLIQDTSSLNIKEVSLRTLVVDNEDSFYNLVLSDLNDLSTSHPQLAKTFAIYKARYIKAYAQVVSKRKALGVLEDKQNKDSLKNAQIAEKYNQEHSVWNTVNPFYDITHGLQQFVSGIAKLLGGILGIVLVFALFAFLSPFFPIFGTMLLNILSGLRTVLGSIETLHGTWVDFINSFKTPPVPPATTV